MIEHNQPSSSGEYNTEQNPEPIDGTPWQEDELWESAGPGVIPGQDRTEQGSNDELKKKAGQSVEAAKQALQDVGSLAAEKSAMAARKIRDFGNRAFSEQKERAAEEVGAVSSAIHKIADNLHSERDENLAEYVEAAAEQIDRVERYLRTRTLDSMYSDLHGMARRRPELVAGGMFIAGVALARFLKASRPDNSARESSSAYAPSALAAGPLVSPRGEPITPPLYPPPRDISTAVPTNPIDKTPEVESWKPE